MIEENSNRGFQRITQKSKDYEPLKIFQSSAIDTETEDGIERPGTSYLWIGESHCNRAEVKEIIKRLQNWLDTGNLHYNQ